MLNRLVRMKIGDVGYWEGHGKNRLGRTELVEVGQIGWQMLSRLKKKEVAVG